MVDKQRKNALKQASFVFQRFIEQFVVDVGLTGLPLDIGIPELTMPRSRKVTTVCNGKREVWTDYEETKAYFLEMMMTAEGEERDRA